VNIDSGERGDGQEPVDLGQVRTWTNVLTPHPQAIRFEVGKLLDAYRVAHGALREMADEPCDWPSTCDNGNAEDYEDICWPCLARQALVQADGLVMASDCEPGCVRPKPHGDDFCTVPDPPLLGEIEEDATEVG
jgi:hypothetical protein